MKLGFAKVSHNEMMQFSPGEQVTFEPPGRGRQIGTLVKFNQKTVTVITESGHKWNVSPHLLNKLKKVEPRKGKQSKVVKLHKPK